MLSREDYLYNILEEEFNSSFLSLYDNKLLAFELANIATYCHDVFEAFAFSEENEDDRFLRYAIIERISQYGL